MNGLRITLLLCFMILASTLHASESVSVPIPLPTEPSIVVEELLPATVPEQITEVQAPAETSPSPPKSVECLAKAMYHEARGEGDVGMIAVAFVIYNRTHQGRWPRDICSVVYQPHQFFFTNHPKIGVIHQLDAYHYAIRLAEELLNGGFEHKNSPCKDATYFDSLASSSKRGYSDRRQFITTIGHHHFFK